jgi:hypothetical protein
MSALLCYHFWCTVFMMMRGQLELARSSTRHDQGTLVLFSALQAQADGITSKTHSRIMPRRNHIDARRWNISIGCALLKCGLEVEIHEEWREITLKPHHKPQKRPRSALTVRSFQTGPQARCGNPESTCPKTRNPQSRT